MRDLPGVSYNVSLRSYTCALTLSVQRHCAAYAQPLGGRDTAELSGEFGSQSDS